MARKKKSYRVLRACHNNKSGKSFDVGDTVKTGDFKAAIIVGWLEIVPPVLVEIAED